MNRQVRASIFERSINKVATSRGQAYFQRDPKTGRIRGIAEYVGEDGVIKFVPEKPIIGSDAKSVMAKLQSFVTDVQLTDGGQGEPWHAESNMPFDANGNRVL